MVLTRAQRAQSAAGGPAAVESASVPKTKAVKSAAGSQDKAIKAKPSKTAAKAKEEEKSSKVERPAARATSSTTSATAKSKPIKEKDNVEPKAAPKAASKTTRTRKQVKFVDADDTNAAENKTQDKPAPQTDVATKGRPKKGTPSVATTTKLVKPAVKKTVATKASASAKSSITQNDSNAKSRAKSVESTTNSAQAAGLGKPIRAKKSAVPATKAVKNIGGDDLPSTTLLTATSSLAGPEPKLAPPIRASPSKVKGSPVRINMAQPVFAPSDQKSTLSLASPVRMTSTVHCHSVGSPIRATPKRMPQTLQSASVSQIRLAAPVFANPLLQSPIRPSAKKNIFGSTQLLNPPTPSGSIGTPLRWPLTTARTGINVTQTVQPKKRSYIESPQRPASAQAVKKFKTVGTPQRLFGAGLADWQVRADIAAESRSVKKTVAFEDPAVDNSNPQTPSKVAMSPSYKVHRMSAVTEVTEPEETLPELVSAEVLEEMLLDTDMTDVTSCSIVGQQGNEDVCMAQVVGTEFFKSSPVKEAKLSDDVISEDQATPEAQVPLTDIIETQYFNSSPKKPQNKEIETIEVKNADFVVVDNLDGIVEAPSTVQIDCQVKQKTETIESHADQEQVKQPVLNSSLLAADVLDIAIATPLPEPLTILSGMSFYVDVWAADGTNANHFFIPLLEELGAVVCEQFVPEVSHVLFKDGQNETLKKVVASHGKVSCLNVGWAVDCERFMQRVPEQGYEIDPCLEGTFTPAPRTPLQEIPSNRKMTPSLSQKSSKTLAKSPAKTPGRSPSKALGKTPRKTPSRTPGKTPGKTPGRTPGTVKFNATIMAFHEATQTPELAKDSAVGDENAQSPLAHVTPLVQKTCPPKQTGQQLFASDVTKSAVKKRLFQGRKSLGAALSR